MYPTANKPSEARRAMMRPKLNESPSPPKRDQYITAPSNASKPAQIVIKARYLWTARNEAKAPTILIINVRYPKPLIPVSVPLKETLIPKPLAEDQGKKTMMKRTILITRTGI